MGPSFLANCYLKIEFHIKFRLDPPSPLNRNVIVLIWHHDLEFDLFGVSLRSLTNKCGYIFGEHFEKNSDYQNNGILCVC